MTAFNRRSPRPRAVALATLLILILPSVAAAATAAGLYYERTLMREADGRCRLFAPEISAALSSSSLQARNAALRAGSSDAALSATADRARLAAFSVPCTSPDLTTAADRVRKAFAGYAKMSYMRFPGDLSAWEAERNPTAPVVNHRAVEGPRWRLSEPGAWDGAGTGALTFGLAADGSTPLVMTTSPGAAQAATALLVVRDPIKARAPYLDPRRPGLAGRAPPRNITRAFVAQTRGPAAASLLPRGQSQGMQFTFPPAAAKALEGLDPREAVAVEFVYPDRPTERAVF